MLLRILQRQEVASKQPRMGEVGMVIGEGATVDHIGMLPQTALQVHDVRSEGVHQAQNSAQAANVWFDGPHRSVQ